VGSLREVLKEEALEIRGEGESRQLLNSREEHARGLFKGFKTVGKIEKKKAVDSAYQENKGEGMHQLGGLRHR